MSTTKTHISLNVRDVERSARFYEAFFGAPVHKRRPGYANFDLETPALKLALNEMPSVERGGPLNHMGVVVETAAEVADARDRLKAAGMATFDENDTTCCYARQDKVWVRDPDGNAWEVYTITDDLLDAGLHPQTPSSFTNQSPSPDTPPPAPSSKTNHFEEGASQAGVTGCGPDCATEKDGCCGDQVESVCCA